jgi:hypothetical protein
MEKLITNGGRQKICGFRVYHFLIKGGFINAFAV